MKHPYMKKITVLIIVLAAWTHDQGAAKITGLARNDAMGVAGDSFEFNDILETRLVVDADYKDWKFYGDGRVYVYYGEDAAADRYYRAVLLRSFVRYFAPIGDFTLGKTYINFGNTGTFNIFEFSKDINFNDLAYDKEGILALEYAFYSGDSFMGKCYGGMYHADPFNQVPPAYCGGLSLGGNAGSFDFAFVANRIDTDRNIMGLYFKGDAEVGIQASYGFHFNDPFSRYFSEASAGIDYSFLDGHIITSVLFYFNERGRTVTGNQTYSNDYFLSARYYVYCSITAVVDEFLSTRVDYFINAVDGSLLVIPSLNYIIVDGLSLSLLVPVPVGHNHQEFSCDRSGYAGFVVRVEGKFKIL